VDAVARAFREGGGVPYAAYRPEFTDVMDALGRGVFDELLVEAYLPLLPGLAERLEAGARVADVGCGTGHAIVLLAGAFRASSFVGYDLAADAIARARSEAAPLANVRFEVRDAARLEVTEPFDVVFVFDAIHDEVAPAAVLEQRARAMLAEAGFADVVVHEASGDPLNAVFVASRPGA
jgi:SAM-dependent methyltransferase